MGRLPIGSGQTAPTHAEVQDPPGWWGSLFLLTADATFFGSFLFGYAYLWTVAPGWPPPVLLEGSWLKPAVGLGGRALAGMLGARSASHRSKGGAEPGIGAQAAGLSLLLVALLASLIFPRRRLWSMRITRWSRCS